MTISAALAVPSANGVGATADISAMGVEKTVVVRGDLQGRIIIEARQTAGGPWDQVAYFTQAGVKSFRGAYAEARARVQGYVSGSATADVGGDSVGGQFASLTVPGSDGVGPAVDVSAFGALMTAVVGGAPYQGAVAVEISQDGSDWGQPFKTFTGRVGSDTRKAPARFARVRRSGAGIGTPTVTLGAVNDSTDGGDGTAVPGGERTNVIWYVRPAGDDANDGTSPSTAFATLTRAFQALRRDGLGLRQIIDVTDMKGANALSFGRQLDFPQILGGENAFLDGSEGGPNNFSDLAPCVLRAEMDLIQSVTISGNTPDADTGLQTINVNETLSAGAHVGQMLIGSGFFEHGVIVANDTGSVTVAQDSATFTGPVGIYEPGAEIIAGDDTDSFTNSTVINATCDWTIIGVKFSSTADSKQIGLRMTGPRFVRLSQCQLTGFVADGMSTGSWDCVYDFEQGGNSATATVRSCGGGGLQIRHSFFNTTGFEWDTPYILLINVVADNCRDEIGRSHFTGGRFEFENVHVTNAQGVGMTTDGDHAAQLVNVKVDDSASHGIVLLGGVRRHRLSNVQGSGNSGFGCRIRHGAQASVLGGTGITGSSGECDLGAAGAVLWSSAPNTDVGAAQPEFCGIY